MINKPDFVYIYQGDIGYLADSLGDALKVSPRAISDGLYMFGSSLALEDVEDRMRKAEKDFAVIEIRNYYAQGTGTPLLGALFALF
ncbi:hypothetical protein JH25_07640 [Pseudomonas sp. BRG-100]|uniref:hypothetical protein n=1 Tax=Pseudomonas sp. BRG-100 TaxID=1524267 RepID=UPI0004E6830C|nr:hypothetical protein [Pseudomonas sp. BRG-100]KFF43649.1 hypothetical protein JH25_07640 [Pseudomonas sp. BRG-100]